MNFISHLLAVFEQFNKDSRLNATHISLYLALFQLWNLYRFQDVFFINRGEVMNMSKIGSRDTYHRCLKDLHEWKYLIYLPSHNPYKGSKIRMLTFGTTSRRQTDNFPTSIVKVPVSKTNNNKQEINNNKEAPEQNIVQTFFQENSWPFVEAEKFFNYYQSLDWTIGGKSRITDWKAAAKSWMLKSEQFVFKKKNNHLKTSRFKDYGEPL